MGCCNIRYEYDTESLGTSVSRYIRLSGLDSFSCRAIELLDIQFSEENISKEAFNLFKQGSPILISYNFLCIRGKLTKTNLKYALLLFSPDEYQNKVSLFHKLIDKNPRKLMEFIELKNQIYAEKIPLAIYKSSQKVGHDIKSVVERSRLISGKISTLIYQKIMEDDRNLSLLLDEESLLGKVSFNY